MRMTEPLKHWISIIVVDTLHGVGYPIGRTGVMITVGPYELLVADACSGLNSMFSLAALGALFIHVMGRKSRLHTASAGGRSCRSPSPPTSFA